MNPLVTGLKAAGLLVDFGGVAVTMGATLATSVAAAIGAGLGEWTVFAVCFAVAATAALAWFALRAAIRVLHDLLVAAAVTPMCEARP